MVKKTVEGAKKNGITIQDNYYKRDKNIKAKNNNDLEYDKEI